jgi:nucleotide-binding universal stress UspA family protein
MVLVVITPPRPAPALSTGRDMMEIVVGADGSAPSNRALAWAWAEAELRGDASLLVVHAYEPPTSRSPYPYSYSYLPAGTLERLSAQDREVRAEQETIARQQAERVVQDALSAVGADDSGPVVKRLVVARDPAKTLIEMSREADMVVVGSRGRGGFRGLLIGSVSQQVVHHAHCPVLVVR